MTAANFVDVASCVSLVTAEVIVMFITWVMTYQNHRRRGVVQAFGRPVSLANVLYNDGKPVYAICATNPTLMWTATRVATGRVYFVTL